MDVLVNQLVLKDCQLVLKELEEDAGGQEVRELVHAVTRVLKEEICF